MKMTSPVLDTIARIVELGGGSEHGAWVAARRAAFEARTGAFVPEDAWFEERIRAFWSDAVTSGGLGRRVAAALDEGARAWLPALERSHRGLFRVAAADGAVVDAWSGVELEVGSVDDATRAELDASAEQLFDARVVASDDPFTVAIVPGAVFHPREATASIEPILTAARARGLATAEVLDALLRMNRALRSLSRVKVAYAYRVEALSPDAHALPHAAVAVRRGAKRPT
jgi:hypothetical protein